MKNYLKNFNGKKYHSISDLKNNAAIDKEKALLGKYELKGEDLAVALEKSKDNAGTDALKYYVYKNYSWDYRNIDRYKSGSNFISFVVDNKPVAGMDVKLYLKPTERLCPAMKEIIATSLKR